MDQPSRALSAICNCFDMGGSMRIRWIAAFTVAAALASTSASTAQVERGGVPTETQEREAAGSTDLLWNLIGCLGLLGLLGLGRASDNDGYTDDPI
jgi:hypothetical protein